MNVSEVGVNLVARTAQFERGMMRAGKVLGSFRRAALAAVGLGSAVQAARSFMAIGDGLDRIAKLSDRLGVSTEALSKLRFVASQTGIEFETMAMGFQRMLRRVSAAAGGEGEAKEALKELGLDAKALAGMKPEQQLIKIADAFKTLNDSQRAIFLSQKIFDSEGVIFLQAFKDGGKGIDDLMKKMDDMGGALSEKHAKEVTAFKDRIDALTTSMMVLAERGFVAVAEASNSFGDKSKEWFPWTINLAKSMGVFAEDAGQGIGAAFAAVGAAIEGNMSGAWEVLKQAWNESEESSQRIQDIWNGTESTIKEIKSIHGDQITFDDPSTKIAQMKYQSDQDAKAAKDREERARKLYNDIFGAQASSMNAGVGQQISLKRTAMHSVPSVIGKPQLVKDPAIETVIEILRKIYQKSGGATAS